VAHGRTVATTRNKRVYGHCRVSKASAIAGRFGTQSAGFNWRPMPGGGDGWSNTALFPFRYIAFLFECFLYAMYTASLHVYHVTCMRRAYLYVVQINRIAYYRITYYLLYVLHINRTSTTYDMYNRSTDQHTTYPCSRQPKWCMRGRTSPEYQPRAPNTAHKCFDWQVDLIFNLYTLYT
jgi:hypothetical protein